MSTGVTKSRTKLGNWTIIATTKGSRLKGYLVVSLSGPDILVSHRNLGIAVTLIHKSCYIPYYFKQRGFPDIMNKDPSEGTIFPFLFFFFFSNQQQTYFLLAVRLCIQLSSVQSLSHVWCFVIHGLQHVRPPCPSPIPGVYSNSCPLSRWCHPIISSSVTPFSRLQSLRASGSFPMSQLFAWGAKVLEFQLQHPML